MPTRFIKFKNLQQRMRRTMHYKYHRLDTLSEPLSSNYIYLNVLNYVLILEMVINYFDKNCTFLSHSLDLNFLMSFSENNCINPCTLLIAMIYVERVKQSAQQNTTQTTQFHKKSSELFLSALILATKFLNDGGLDEFYWNDEFALVSQISIAKINQLELELLDKLVLF